MLIIVLMFKIVILLVLICIKEGVGVLCCGLLVGFIFDFEEFVVVWEVCLVC